MSRATHSSRGSAPPPKLNSYFIDGEGIHRQVLQAEICKFLGAEATSRPGEYEGRKGFAVKSIRPFTPEMISDLQKMSQEYENEARQYKKRGREEISYEDSQTRIKNDPSLGDARDQGKFQRRDGYGPPPPNPYGYEQDPSHALPGTYIAGQNYGQPYTGTTGYDQTAYMAPQHMMPPQGGGIPAPERGGGGGSGGVYGRGDPRQQNYVYGQPPMPGQHQPGGYYPPSEQPRYARGDEPSPQYYVPAQGGRGRGEQYDTQMGNMPEGGSYQQDPRYYQATPHGSRGGGGGGASDPYARSQRR